MSALYYFYVHKYLYFRIGVERLSQDKRPRCATNWSNHMQPRESKHLNTGTTAAVLLGQVEGPCGHYLLLPLETEP